MKKNLFIILAFICALGLNAQTLTEARTLFSQGAYEKAMPVFAKELKRKPNDATLHYWYGVCLYKTDRQEKAIAHLAKGEQGKIKDASFYLAEYAFNRSDFEECLKHLDTYIMYATGKFSAEIAHMLKTAQKVEQMLNSVEDVVVLDSIIVPTKELLNYIPLHPANGTISLLDKQFRNEKQIKNDGYAYLTEKNDQFYFSDSTENKDLDIFILSKLLDGWEKETLAENINQSSNECNPYLMSDGITIYFASDGYNSIGGYDLYISRYNAFTGSFFNPEPLPMPFNSTYNDYFYIIDEQLGRGYLVSDRNNTPDSLIVYTFLPNEIRTPIKNKSKDELIAFSQLRSIKATQRGLNVDSILAQQDSLYRRSLENINSLEAQEEESGSNDFFIKDSLVYHSENDFQSEEAKVNYKQYLKMKSKYKSAQKELDANRIKYASMPEDSPERKALGDVIIQAEWSQLFLERDLPLKEYKIRELEITILNAKN